MGRIVNYIVRLIRAGRSAYARKWIFLGIFAIIFLASVTALWKLDFLPESLSIPAVSLTKAGESTSVASVSELPTKITISKIGLDTTITNPTTTDIKILDEELLKGAVRYPTSAKLGETGNVVLFGHSSYLPIVGNQAYKTFNGIQKLAVGDVVTVYSSDTAYTYSIRSVMKETADGNTAIPLSIAGKSLTLVTCNSFASKQDRFVVTADFVESHSISS